MAGGKLGIAIGLPPVSGGPMGDAPSDEAEKPGEASEEINVEDEAYRAAATELLTAVESKNVGAIAAALRAACEAHYGAEMAETK